MASRNGTSASALTLSSDEVNYLVYRYMQESGEQTQGAGQRGGDDLTFCGARKIQTAAYVPSLF